MSRISVLFLTIVAPALAILLACLGLFTLPSNPLGWFLLLLGTIYAGGTIIFVLIRREHFWAAQAGGSTVQEERGDRSFWLISLAMMAVFYLSPLEYLLFAGWMPRTLWMKSCGMGLVLLGSALFAWARRSLGANYSGHVSAKEGQELVQSGPYSVIRHPAYAGYLLMALGISLGYSSLAGLIALLGLLVPVLVYRIRIEEEILAAHFGEQWREYCVRVPAFFPRIIQPKGRKPAPGSHDK